MTTDTQNLTVTRSVTVRAGREHAFTVFAARFGGWWPASHHIGESDMADAIIEQQAGSSPRRRSAPASNWSTGTSSGTTTPRAC